MTSLTDILSKQKVYLTIPICILILYAFSSIVLEKFIFDPTAFQIYYNAGKYLFTNPEILYTENIPLPYFYLPSFATVFSIFSILPYYLSEWIYFIILITFSILSVIKFDKILRLKNIDNIFVRLIFLLVLVNGYRIYNTFDWLQSKFIVLYLFLLFFERELKFKDSTKYDTFIFQFIQLNILTFAIGMVPFFAFLLIFYFFNDIKKIFKRNVLQKFGLFILIFILQNFMFIVYPMLIRSFLEGITFGSQNFPNNINISDFLNSTFQVPVDSLSTFYLLLNLYFNISYFNSTALIVSISFMLVITVFLTLNKTLTIDRKFGYFMLFSLFSFIFIRPRTLIVILPLVLLLFTSGLKDEDMNGSISTLKELFIFVKRNKFLVLGLLCIAFLNFFIPYAILLRDIPILQVIPIPLLLLVHTVIYCILAFALYIALLKKNHNKE